MKKTVCRSLFILMACLGLAMASSGCASVVRNTASAVDHAKLETQARMTDSIFLTPEVRTTYGQTLYLHVTNTSEVQEIPLETILAEKFRAKGWTVLDQQKDAAYVLQLNLLQMGKTKKALTKDALATGAATGAVVGALLTHGTVRRVTAGGVIGSAVGSLVGAAIGSAFKVGTFAGVVDCQVLERAPGAVNTTTTTDAAQGSATKVQSTSTQQSDYREYRTRVVASATQTNIDEREAIMALTAKVSDVVVGIF